MPDAVDVFTVLVLVNNGTEIAERSSSSHVVQWCVGPLSHPLEVSGRFGVHINNVQLSAVTHNKSTGSRAKQAGFREADLWQAIEYCAD